MNVKIDVLAGVVIRRIGGLENHFKRGPCKFAVIRRIGGLETNGHSLFDAHLVIRRIGGLENAA